MGVGRLPRWKELGVVEPQELPTFPCGFVFRVIIQLDLVEPSSLVACDSVFLVENLDGICLVRQIRFQWMVSSITTYVGGFRNLLSWVT
jgi:hypothetical protein